jgi:hypothetical protein
MTIEPLAFLGAAPKQATDVETLTQLSGVRELLEDPPHSRHSGFNLLTLDRASLIGGTRLRVSNGTRKHIDLLADGTLLAVAAFNEFLGWGREDFWSDPKANGLAIIEFTYDFLRLYERIVGEYLKPVPSDIRIEIGLSEAIFYDAAGNQRKLYLTRGPVGGFQAFSAYAGREAPEDSFSATADIDLATQAPYLAVGDVAYQLVRALYNWFGHTDDAIPYVNDEGTAIDIEQIQAVT